MANLIQEARKRIPFHLSFNGHCEGRCDECPEKLLEFLDMDLSDWESRLKHGDMPSLEEVHALAKNCRDVHAVLHKEGFIQEPHS